MAVIGEQLLTPDTGWQRINNTHDGIDYSNSNLYYTSATNAYETDMHYSWSIPSDSKVVFSFYGTKIRIICLNSNEQPDYSQNYVKIDDTTEDLYKVKQGSRFILAYEKTGLDEGIHKVEILLTQGTTFALDAIDIDETGYILALPKTVGDVLTAPENGWQRIDDTNSKIYYTGTWTQYTDSEAWNAGHTMTATIGDYLIFYVCSNNIRIISPINNNLSSNISIFIDSDTLSETYSIYNSSAIYNTIVYEKLNMENKYHKVMIKANTNAITLFDAVDIDDDGYLLTEKEYLQQTSQDKFPVMIGDDTIVSETNIANYASTLVNGEKKLLVSSVLESIYVTDGAGGYTQVGWSMNKVNAELSTRDAKIRELEQAVNDIKASIIKNTI